MKAYVKCLRIENIIEEKMAVFSDESAGIVITILLEEHKNEKFKVGHEYEFMLTE